MKKNIPTNWEITHFYQQWSPIMSDGTLRAVIEIPQEALSNAEGYVPNAKPFADTSSLYSDTCFTRSLLTDDLLKLFNANSKGLYCCKLNEHILKGEKTGDIAVFDDSKVIILDKGNKRLLVYILYM
ncbi:hypothetical protein [Persicitalea jodogahamensis]|uniref:Uncharacterized protein n=1 Tax=Persicitalea jodogahamensis TaxID=402147 RepID=A0A8J3D3F1_9BACT|nr:hypothetical protein [Persicitalea jodogahamensis]GHB68160.1 hypothetical protein GCM10007390_21850 [Persicitalea jodogahamensis]